jgi:hypothetical protein
MLLLTETLWQTDRILKVKSSSDWSQTDASLITRCVLERIQECLKSTQDTNKKMRLIIDLSQGDFPPWLEAIKIAKFFVSMKALLEGGLEFTVIYAPTDMQQLWLGRILRLYTPARPVHMVKTVDELKAQIKSGLTS